MELPLAAIVVMAMAVVGIWAWDTRRTSAVLAALFLATQTMHAQEQFQPAAPYLLGGLILLASCGLGYVGCQAVKACKRIPRGERGTNLIEEFHVAGEDCEYGAAFFWPEKCYAERFFSTNREPVVTILNIVVGATNCTLSLQIDVESQFVDIDGLKEELASHALFVPDSPRISESYSRNRHPVTAEQVPIKFNFETRTATIGGGGVMVTVESSPDLTDWIPLLKLNAPAGTALEIPDVSHGRQFYRATIGGVSP
jgi:hypothetical protein